MSRAALGLILLVFLCVPAGANELDTKRIEILDPVVIIHGEHTTNTAGLHTDPLGAGVVVESKRVGEKWKSTIWTARHLFFMRTWNAKKGEWEWEPREFDKYWAFVFDHVGRTAYSYELTLVKHNEKLDITIVEFEGTSIGIAAVNYDRPKFFQRAYAVGMSIDHAPTPSSGEISAISTEPIIEDGKLTGHRDTNYVSTAPINWGYSGGGLFIETDLGWQLAAILVAMPMHSGFPVRHHGKAIPTSLIRAWLDE